MEPRRKPRAKSASKAKASRSKSSPSVVHKKNNKSVRPDKVRSPVNQDKYYFLFLNARDAMFLADPRTRMLLDANPAAVRLMGYSREKLLTMKADQLHPDSVRAKTMQSFKSHAAADEISSLVLTSRGREVPVGIRTSLLMYDGMPHLLGIFRDVTEHKKEADRLRLSEKRALILNKASLTLLRVDDPLKQYAYLLDFAREITQSRFGFIGYIDPETGYLVCPTMTKDIWSECKIPDKDIVFKEFTALWGWVLTHKKVVLCNDPKNDPRSAPPPYGHIPIPNFLGVPCVSRGRVVGMIGLAGKEGGYTREDQDLISDYTQLITVSILGHQRLLERKRNEEQLRKREELEKSLLAASRVLPLCRDFSEAWEIWAKLVTKSVGARAASLYLPDKKENCFRLAGHYGLSKDYGHRIMSASPILINRETVLGKSFCTKKPEFTRDVETDPRFEKWRKVARGEGYRSLICLPLLHEKDCMGVASFYFEQPMAFARDEIGMMRFAVIQLAPELARIGYDRKIRESEALFRKYFELGLVGMAVTSLERGWLHVNDRLCEILGYTRKELLKMTWSELTYPEDLEPDLVQFNRVIEGEIGGYSMDKRFIRKDGRVIFTSLHVSCIRREDGSIEHFIAHVQDITERKNMEMNLNEQKTFLHDVIESIQDGISILDKDLNIIFTNNTMKRWYAHNLPHIGRKCFDVYHGRTRPCEICPSIQTIRTGKESIEIVPFTGEKGVQGWMELYSFPLVDSQTSEVAGVIEYVRDITERMKSQSALQESHDRLIKILDSLDALVYVTDMKTNEVLFVNEYGRNTFGDVVGKVCWQVLQAGQSGPCAFCTNPYLLTPDGKPAKPYVWEFQSTTNKNWYYIRDRAITWVDGRIVRMEIAADITERKRVETALRESEEKYRMVFEFSPMGIIHVDRNGVCTACNDKVLEILGAPRERIIGFNIRKQIVHPQLKQAVDAGFSGKTGRFQGKYISVTGGRECIIKLDVSPIHTEGGSVSGCIGIFEDISERSRLEEELSRAQRLETAGRIAGQIAHDFNNLLSPLMAYPDLMRMEFSDKDHPVMPLLDQMQSAAIQMAEINQQLLTLGRRGHYTLEAVYLNTVIQELLKSFPVPRTVTVEKNYDPGLLPVKGGSAQLTRVFTNIIANAIESMADVGTLRIATMNVYLEHPLKSYETIQRGEYARVDIEDNGCGIPPEIMNSIFDPFFTTKKADKKRGSGLGLSIVKAVMEDHSGYIAMESRPGKGTTFSFYFPITRDMELLEKPAEEIAGGSERVLIADDDPLQRDVITRLLGQLGYKVHAVESGEEAVEYVRGHPQDMLILDMIMGGIDGTETFRRIREFSPDQKAVILSGYAESGRVAEAQRMGAGSFVRKPVDLKSLARAVRLELEKT